jgi:pilus assembly protein CpaF
MANLNLPDKAIRSQLASAINVVVQVARLTDGTRKITSVTEVTGMEGPTVTMQDLFVYERKGYDANNKVRGVFKPTGIRPRFSERLFGYGIRLPQEMFEASLSSAAD